MMIWLVVSLIRTTHQSLSLSFGQTLQLQNMKSLTTHFIACCSYQPPSCKTFILNKHHSKKQTRLHKFGGVFFLCVCVCSGGHAGEGTCFLSQFCLIDEWPVWPRDVAREVCSVWRSPVWHTGHTVAQLTQTAEEDALFKTLLCLKPELLILSRSIIFFFFFFFFFCPLVKTSHNKVCGLFRLIRTLFLGTLKTTRQPLRNSSSVRWPSPFSSILEKMFFAL